MNISELLLKVIYKDVTDAKKETAALGKEVQSTEKNVGSLGKAFSGLKGVGGPIADAANKLEDVGSSAVDAARSISMMGLGLGTVVAGLAGVATAVVAVERIGFAANKAADDADELSQKLGITINRLEALKLIANENGSSVEGLQRTYDKLSKSLNKFDDDNEKTQLAFKALVLTQQDLANKTEQQIAGVVIKRWQELGMTAKATAATAQLLGASFRDNIPAILAAADATSDYADRVRKFAAGATPDLVEAGGKQEKALSNLGLAWQGLSNEVARWSANMLTTITNWAASALNSIRSVLAEFRQAQDVASASQNSISNKRRSELLKQARDQVYDGSNPNATEGDVNRRFKELLSQEQQSNFRRFELGQSADTYAGVAAAQQAAKLQQQSAAVNMSPKKGGGADEYKGMFASKAAEMEYKSYEQYARAIDQLQEERETQERTVALERRKRQQQEEEQNRRLAQSYMDYADPVQQYMRALEEVNTLLANKNLTEEQALLIQARIREDMQRTIELEKQRQKPEDFAAGWQQAFEQYAKAATDAGAIGAQAFQQTVSMMENAITQFVTTGKLGFKEFLASFLKMIAGILAKWAVLNVLSYATGGGPVPLSAMFKGFAKGGVVQNGVQKFAKGGIVTSPTTFPMAGGKTGLMGEAGTEAIMPVTRTRNGDLGVNAKGLGGTNITIHQTMQVNGDIDSPERQAKIQREWALQTKAIVKQTLVDEKRRGGVLA